MSANASQPSRIRFALLIFLFVYPLVTIGLLILMPLTQGWPLPLRTLILVPVIVASMVWGVIPLIQTRLRHLL
ncbi:hypothetical protein H4P12_14210 [Paracoccus sp. 11-3]|uniref:Uncharacterized protein n=1 Tax=Paracoccus amoyensis TaxID=2760093 RepID=A0A926GFU8_9RHOB|nr:hypothetical protein [Paracoccus amoyensis]MBC9247831.1 hypothetical protein [Paracoccus amoyensis]